MSRPKHRIVLVAFDFYMILKLSLTECSLRQSYSGDASSQTLLNYTSARSAENRLQYGFATELQRENYSLYGSYRTDSVELSAGATESLTNDMYWGRAGGSIVFAKNQLFIANRIIDGFAIIDTGGFSGVPVRKENQLIGSTNAGGQLLVTGLNSYNISRFAIDSTKLPVNTRIEWSSATVATARNMGALIEFPISYSYSALLLPAFFKVVDTFFSFKRPVFHPA